MLTRDFDVSLTSAKRLFGWQAALFPTGYSGLREVRAGALRGRRADAGRLRAHSVASVCTSSRRRATVPEEELGALSRLVRRRADGPRAGRRRTDSRRARASVVRDAARFRRRQRTTGPSNHRHGLVAGRAPADAACSACRRRSCASAKATTSILEQHAARRRRCHASGWRGFWRKSRRSAAAAEQTVASTLAKARFWLRHQARVTSTSVSARRSIVCSTRAATASKAASTRAST